MNVTGRGSVASAPAAWRLHPERCGPLHRLTWGGRGHGTAQWQPQWACLHLGNLYLLPSEYAEDSEAICHNTWLGRRAAVLTAEAPGAAQHCVAVMKQGADLARGSQDSSSLVIRLESAESVRNHLEHSMFKKAV